MTINKDILISWSKKGLPIVVGILISLGIIDQITADQLPPIMDAVLILVAAIPTLLSSVKTHSK